MFSVILPLFNKAPFLCRAIDSVLAQDCTNWELLVVDNNSTDGGPELLRQYNDSRIRLLHEPQQGVSFARNKGVNEARYPWICFLDADDTWSAGILSHFSEQIKKYPEAVMYSAAYQIIETHSGIRPVQRMKEDALSEVYPANNFFKAYVHADMPVHTSSVCVSKSLFLEMGGFDTSIHYGEDTLLWSRIFLKGKVVVSSFMGATYHRNAGNRSDQSPHTLKELPVIKTFETMFAATPEWKPYEKDFKAFVAKHLFVSVMANIRKGDLASARKFLFDRRMLAYAQKTRLLAAILLCLLPRRISSRLLKLLIRLKLVK